MKNHLHSGRYPDEAEAMRRKVYELTEFFTDVLKVEKPKARFPHKVGLAQSCHGQRGLKLAQMSELIALAFSEPEQLLSMVEGLDLIDLTCKDECCGFRGAFCVAEETVSVKVGKDRVMDHLQHEATYIYYRSRHELPDVHEEHSAQAEKQRKGFPYPILPLYTGRLYFKWREFIRGIHI